MRSVLTRFVLAIAASVAFAMTSARAEVIFVAHLTTDQEPIAIVPTTTTGDPRPIPSGEGLFVLNDAETELSMTVTIFNIDVTGTQTADPNDNLVNAHIHAGNVTQFPTAPVRWGFVGSPFNDTEAPSIVVTPFASGVGGTFTSVWNQNEGNAGTTLTAQIPNLLAERAYINFHTTQFPGGEIRGTLQVPEPGSLLLVVLGAALILVIRRKRSYA